MCGIVGYVGQRAVQEVLLAGLEKLEYRGYDSAGISIQTDAGLDCVRAVGNLSALKAAVAAEPSTEDGVVAVLAPPATTGIGHTRWATHGRVTEENAHPHYDPENRVHVVVNGIVENYMELKQELLAQGACFTSETDVEVIAHLIARDLDAYGLVEATRRTYNRLRGHYSFVAVANDEPGVLVGARKECPLIVGRGDGEQFLASGIPAFLAHTRTVQTLEDDELVVLTSAGAEFMKADGTPIEREVDVVDWDADAAEKGGFETFMLKEIYEQADAVADTIADRTVRPDGVDLPELDDELLRGAQRIIIVACGTSYHAGLIGRYALEEWARVPVEMDIASEYRYRNPVVGPGDLVIGITQSGRDARHAGRHAAGPRARRDGPGRHEHHGLSGHAGRRRRHLHPRGPGDRRRRDQDVRRPGGGHVPAGPADGRIARHAVHGAPHGARGEAQADSRTTSARCSTGARRRSTASPQRHYDKDFFLYLGRHVGLPVGLEGALKLKEISYIATDAYAAGEMKHGPIALLDQRHAGRRGRDRLARAREGDLQHAGGPGARRARDRGGERGDRPLRARRGDPQRPVHRLDAPAAARRDPAADPRVPDRAPARAERRPAAQPGQDRDRGVAASVAVGGGRRPQLPAELLGIAGGEHQLRASL